MKYIELRKNWSAENYSGTSANISKLTNSCWKVCNGFCAYLNHGITKDTFIALQIPVKGAQVLWCVCVSLCCLSFREDMCDFYQILGACCLRSWVDLPPAKGAKSAIYDCLVRVALSLYTSFPSQQSSQRYTKPFSGHHKFIESTNSHWPRQPKALAISAVCSSPGSVVTNKFVDDISVAWNETK